MDSATGILILGVAFVVFAVATVYVGYTASEPRRQSAGRRRPLALVLALLAIAVVITVPFLK